MMIHEDILNHNPIYDLLLIIELDTDTNYAKRIILEIGAITNPARSPSGDISVLSLCSEF